MRELHPTPREISTSTQLAFFLSLALGAVAASGAEKLHYNRDIRPILSDKCFHCHGPDKNKRDSGLRLDVREETLALRDGIHAIVPGKPDESEIIARISTTDADDHMPPAKSKLEALTPAEIGMLKRWIAEGAEYEAHWAFIPLVAADVRRQADQATAGAKSARLLTSSATDPMDAAVSAGLAQRGLKPQPEADRSTLIRRVSFDITGLPPSPQEVETFLRESAKEDADNDKVTRRQGDKVSDASVTLSPSHLVTPSSAYERVVDRLLASPRFGERMAVDWLDVARYADSYGFQVDREREMWPWRDWVIRAFNENLPFDKFITWQIAGDLLPNATDDQILATAFNRLHQQESEGGSVEEEYRVEYVCDRVQTFATAFLGLTFECARCHDHKFDPITQKEFYGLFSFFQNVDEAGLYSFFTQSMPTPAAPIMDLAGKAKLAALRKAVAEAEQKTAALRESKRAAFSEWLKSRPPEVSIPGEVGRFDFDTLEKGKLANALGAKKPAILKGENKLVPGVSGQAVQFSGDDAVNLQIGNFRSNEPFSVSLWVKTPDKKDRAVVFHRSKAWTDAASRGYELLIEDGRLKWSLIHFWPGDAISIRSQQPLAINAWTHVVVTSDGSGRAAGLRLYVNGVSAATDTIQDRLTRDITGGGGDNITLGERFRDRGFKGGTMDDFRVFARALTEIEALATFDQKAANEVLGSAGVPPAGSRVPREPSGTAGDPSGTNAKTRSHGPRGTRGPAGGTPALPEETLFDYFLATTDADWKKQLDLLETARGEVVKFSTGQREIMVMRELPQPKKSYVLFRGQYDQRRDEAPAIVPAWLAPFPANAPRNRLGLARWLTEPQHPLTARVTVNRFWLSMWGRGLVKTAEDFGSQGARPLYPEVLDWLAARFIQSGWDVKALMKTIVMSRTYRQRSIADAKTMTDDPDNEWLARGPRIRLAAEMVRDNALAASGLLAERIGGPPVNPYELSEAFKPATPSGGDGVYRRSIYTNWRRTGPPPAMVAFDAPRRAVCIAKRERTDSPLQAFILLNGIQYVEAARVLGEKLHRDAKGDVAAMIEQGFLRCLSRKPDAREREITTRLYQEQLAHFQAKPAEAAALLKIGNTVAGKDVAEPELAAAAVLAQALLNHDACVVKR